MTIEKTVVQMAKEELEKRYTRNMAVASSSLCVHCGMCIDQCHYHMATRDPKLSPVAEERIVKEAERLEVEEIIVTECGHD